MDALQSSVHVGHKTLLKDDASQQLYAHTTSGPRTTAIQAIRGKNCDGLSHQSQLNMGAGLPGIIQAQTNCDQQFLSNVPHKKRYIFNLKKYFKTETAGYTGILILLQI